MSAALFWKLKKQIDFEVDRLGWDTDTCKAYIWEHYQKKSRLVMNDAQLKHMICKLQLIESDKPSSREQRKTRKARRRKRK